MKPKDRKKEALGVSIQKQLAQRVRRYAVREHGGNVSKAAEVLLYIGLREVEW